MSTPERAVYFVDADLRITNVNPVVLRQWGKSRGEVINRTLVELFPAAEGGPVHQAMLTALRSYRPARFRMTSQLVERDVEVEIYPVHGGLQVTATYI
jgi:PAS domain S-box-containing protein